MKTQGKWMMLKLSSDFVYTVQCLEYCDYVQLMNDVESFVTIAMSHGCEDFSFQFIKLGDEPPVPVFKVSSPKGNGSSYLYGDLLELIK
jgi:hypothetical protein